MSWIVCGDAVYLRSLICVHVSGARCQPVSSLSDKVITDELTGFGKASKRVSSERKLANVKCHVNFNASKPEAQCSNLILQTSRTHVLDLNEHGIKP